MIKIEFEAANGADLRKEMLDLLGLGNTPIVKGPTREEFEASIADTAKSLKENYDDTQRLEATRTEPVTRKRRSKAEIEAEAAGTTEEVPATEEATADAPATEEAPKGVTAEDLTKKCVELGRAGKRDAVLALFENSFGGATISKKDGKPQLTADQYEAVMEALNAIG